MLGFWGQVWKVALASSHKRPRAQVNLVEDISEEEEERDSQVAVNLMDDDVAHLQRDKHARTEEGQQKSALATSRPCPVLQPPAFWSKCLALPCVKDALSRVSKVSCQSEDREVAEDTTRSSILIHTRRTK